MSVPILFLINYIISVINRCCSKFSSKRISYSGNMGYALFLIINSIIACIFFLFSAGFAIKINTLTLAFSVLYAITVLVALISGFKIFDYLEISNVQVIGSSSNLILTVLLGFALFGERITIIKLIRLVLMLAAFLIIFSGSNKKSKAKAGFMPVLLGLILSGVCNFLVLKYYSIYSGSNDNNSFFFLTNVLVLAAAVIWIAFQSRKNTIPFHQYKGLLKIGTFIAFASITLTSNIGSLVNLLLIEKIEASILYPIMSALDILCGITGSWILRERLDFRSYLAGILAIISVII